MEKISFQQSYSYTLFSAQLAKIGNPTTENATASAFNAPIFEPLFAPHYMRVWVIKKGYGQVETTKGTVELFENHAYFFPSHSIISTNCPQYIEQFYVDFLQNPEEVPIEQQFLFDVVSLKADLITKLIASLIELNRKKESWSPWTPFIISNTITTILSQFLIGYNQNYERLNPALTYIARNYNKTIPLTHLANLCDYSPEYFSSLFKSILSVSPQRYIINTRLNHAKILLANTNKKIREIGEEVGYPDPMHFTKIFTNMLSMTPTEYRNSCNATSNS